MIQDKLYLYNNVFTILLLLGIILISISLLFFVSSNLMTYFRTSLRIDNKKSKNKSEENSKKRKKDVYSKSGNLKEIDYNKNHEIKNPSGSLATDIKYETNNMDSLHILDEGDEETTYLEDEGSEETTSLYDDGSEETTYLPKEKLYYEEDVVLKDKDLNEDDLSDDDYYGEKETTLLDRKEHEFNIEKIDYDDIPCNSDFYEDMIDKDYFEDIPLDTGTLLLEDPGEGETSLLSESKDSLNEQVENNRKWSEKLTQFDIIDGESVVVVSSKEKI